MNLDWTHPVATIAGIVIGVSVMLFRDRSPKKYDVTIRHEKEKDDDC